MGTVASFLLIAILAVCASTLGAASRSSVLLACRPVDVTVTRTVAEMQTTITATDADTRAMRDSLKIIATRASDVSYVTDEKTCTKAVTALNTYLGTATSGQVYVYKLGTDYMVEDPTVGQASEFRALRI